MVFAPVSGCIIISIIAVIALISIGISGLMTCAPTQG